MKRYVNVKDFTPNHLSALAESIKAAEGRYPGGVRSRRNLVHFLNHTHMGAVLKGKKP